MRPLRPFHRLVPEGGQALIIVVFAMVPMLLIAGLAIDLGFAYKQHRALQASADAAALAGAQELPSATTSQSVAKVYGTKGKNTLVGSATVAENVTTKCLTSIPGCNPVNAITVEETASVPTFFARVVGIKSIGLKAKATACSPCGTKPVDIVLVLDRTYSMCQDSNGNNNNCSELTQAKTGIKTFLSYFDASTAKIGLAVFPPAPSVSQRCSDPANYSSSTYPYVVVPLAQDYKRSDGSLNTTSNLVSTVDCLKAKLTTWETAYANAIESAQAELEAHGRAGVPNVIVFFTDGAANTGPTYSPYNVSPGKLYRTQPCHQGVTSANTAKSKGTIIYSIGYAVNDGGSTGGCRNGDTNALESPSITPDDTLRAIATVPANYLTTPSASQLQTIYATIAQDLSKGSSSLVDESVH
jgi:hypothetical protein